MDTRLCSREGGWKENLGTDYEYLYEYMGGMLPENEANKEKYNRLKARHYNAFGKDGNSGLFIFSDAVCGRDDRY